VKLIDGLYRIGLVRPHAHWAELMSTAVVSYNVRCWLMAIGDLAMCVGAGILCHIPTGVLGVISSADFVWNLYNYCIAPTRPSHKMFSVTSLRVADRTM
jgi:hypothetical protein